LPIPASPSTNNADGVLDAESRNSRSACSSMGRLAMPGKLIPEESRIPSAGRFVFKQFLGIARFDPGHRQHVEPPVELLQR
jgi:hypothetical protein